MECRSFSILAAFECQDLEDKKFDSQQVEEIFKQAQESYKREDYHESVELLTQAKVSHYC